VYDKPRVLCVDDEPLLLEGLQLTLRQHSRLTVSESPVDALKLLDTGEAFAVIVSDMRMPGMSGAEFLARAREKQPDAIRILLTGHADMANAIQAVNRGNIFRFLTKPCPPDELVAGVRAAAEQHRLVLAERELLDRTLKGAVASLTEALALAQPETYGRAVRLRQLALDVARHIGLRETWHLEVASMLSDLGAMSLPAETAKKLANGSPLDEAEQPMVARATVLTDQLIGRIPRMEPVLALLAKARKAPGLDATPAEQVLRAVFEFNRLDADGTATERALATMKAHTPAPICAALEALAARSRLNTRTREVHVKDLRAGMTLLADVQSAAGVMLVSRGHVLTDGVLERIRNVHALQGVKEPVLVRVEEGLLPC